jgi:hypothetical protein
MAQADELLTVEQALAELGGVSRRTFYRWRELGRAPRCLKLPNGEIRIRPKKLRKTSSYEIRWITGRRTHSASRRTKALAEAFRSELHRAAKRGDEFNVESGLPDSMIEAESVSENVRTVLSVAQASTASPAR